MSVALVLVGQVSSGVEMLVWLNVLPTKTVFLSCFVNICHLFISFTYTGENKLILKEGKLWGKYLKIVNTLLTCASEEERCDESVLAKELPGPLCGSSVFCGILT